MVGREAYGNPRAIAQWEAALCGRPVPREAHAQVEAFLPYIEARLSEGVRLASLTRHILGLFQGLPGARRWRRHLSEQAPRPGAGVEVVARALAMVSREAAREA